MKRTSRFVQPVGTCPCTLEDGDTIQLPVVPGIFKHAAVETLPDLLRDPIVARKYTIEALRVAPWQVVRAFPRDWLLACLRQADLPDGRRRALEFMLAP